MRPEYGHTYKTEVCRATLQTEAERTGREYVGRYRGGPMRSGWRGLCACGHSYTWNLRGECIGGRVSDVRIGRTPSMDLKIDVTPKPVEPEKMRLRTGYRYAFRNGKGHADIRSVGCVNGQTVFVGKRTVDPSDIDAHPMNRILGNYDPFGKSMTGNPADPNWPWDLVREIGPTPKPAFKVELGKRYVTDSGEIVGPMLNWSADPRFRFHAGLRDSRLWDDSGRRACSPTGNLVREYVPPVKVEVGKRYAFRGKPGVITITGKSEKWPDKFNGKPDGSWEFDLQPAEHSWNSEGRRHADREDAYDLVKELPAVKPSRFEGKGVEWKGVERKNAPWRWTTRFSGFDFANKRFDDTMVAFLYGGKAGGAMTATTPKKTRLQQFDENSAAKLNADRGKSYGDPKVHFSRSSRLKAVIAECKHPEARHALEMIADKIARLIETPDHLDSWQDIAGYARTGVMVTEPKVKTVIEQINDAIRKFESANSAGDGVDITFGSVQKKAAE